MKTKRIPGPGNWKDLEYAQSRLAQPRIKLALNSW
jgi:hypothetical protein